MSEEALALPTEARPFKTVGQTIWIDGDSLVIKYGMLYYGFLGQKRVPVQNIKTVSWKEPGALTTGFLEISILGEPPPSPFASPNVQHQNRFIYERKDVEQWRSLKGWIEKQIGGRDTAAPASTADELRKLADLYKEGLLTESEFESQKAKLLG
ncbi:SHOCT domain-containing protein [Sphingomonas alba]|uniref:SHOCT domain-containing protein n=1 Tax=Sphingomonas alba TaxID=2908208 RepID=A0ABT0RN78_9SPHN|nr:SHOCT domain-containing protein [Sphingomonas alba]MCL6684109.1 SHOCT domain-containing protein [Sphingomonas alba]